MYQFTLKYEKFEKHLDSYSQNIYTYAFYFLVRINCRLTTAGQTLDFITDP